MSDDETEDENAREPEDQGENDAGALVPIVSKFPGVSKAADLVEILKTAPQLYDNFKKVIIKLVGSPERIREIAGAKATAKVMDSAAEATKTILHATAERGAKDVGGGADPELVLRALDRVTREAIISQRRREEVMGAAIQEIPLLIQEGDATGEVDDDKMMYFWRLAETMPEAKMVTYFGKLLAGELHHPGRFSPATIRILSTMTEELSRAFEELCRLSLKDPSDTIVVIPRVGSAPLSGQPLEPYGPKYGMLLELQAAGLIMSMTQATWNLKENDPEAVIEYAGQRAILRAREGKSLGLHDGIFISSAGGELRSLIALAPVPEYTAALKVYLDELGIDFLFPEDDD